MPFVWYNNWCSRAWWNGRHARFRIWCPRRAGSSPVARTRKRLRIGYNPESFSIKSAFVGINPLAWMKSLRDEICLAAGYGGGFDVIWRVVWRFHPSLARISSCLARFYWRYTALPWFSEKRFSQKHLRPDLISKNQPSFIRFSPNFAKLSNLNGKMHKKEG